MYEENVHFFPFVTKFLILTVDEKENSRAMNPYPA
jgi:hypothetical protein